MRFKKNMLSIISIILTMIMFISAVPVLGDSQSDAGGGGGTSDTSGTGAGNSSWDNSSQFLRISLFMAPRDDSQGVESVKAINWNDSNVKQIGKTFDITVDDPNGVVYHSNFKNAREHYQRGYENNIRNYGYNDTNQVKKGNISSVSEFPRVIPKTKDDTAKHDADYLKRYFSEDGVLNEILVKLTELDPTSAPGINIDWLNKGYYINEYGNIEPVAYGLIIEPGIYATVNSKKSAYTLRDTIGWYSKGTENPLSKNPSSCYSIARGLTLQDPSELAYNINFGTIGLSRNAGESVDLGDINGSTVRSYALDGKSNNIMRRAMGVATIVYWGNGQPLEPPYPPLPIISYYYDSDDVYIDESGKHMVDNPTDDDTDSNEGVQTNYELFNKPAHISKIDGKVGTVKIPMVSTEYTPKPVDVKVEYVDENNKVIDKVTISEDEVEETLKNLNQNEKLEYYRDNNEDSVYKLRGLILLNTTADYGIGEIGAGGEKYRGCIGLTANSDKAIFNLEDKDGNILTA